MQGDAKILAMCRHTVYHGNWPKLFFRQEDFPLNTKRINKTKLIAIVLAAVLLLLCAALAFAGNFLFNFALNPNASFTMNDMFQSGSVEGVGGGRAYARAGGLARLQRGGVRVVRGVR